MMLPRWYRVSLALSTAALVAWWCWDRSITRTSCYERCGIGSMDLCDVPCERMNIMSAVFIFIGVAVFSLRLMAVVLRKSNWR